MAQQRLPYLLNRYLSKRCSKEELKEFYMLVNDPAYERELNDLLDQAITQARSEQVLTEAKQKEIIKHIVAHHPITESTGVERMAMRKRVWPLRFVGTAAAILLIFGAFAVILNLFQDPKAKDHIMLSLSKQDIGPGSNKAILTLANGKALNLSDASNGKLAEEAGITVTKTTAGQLVYTVNKTAGKGHLDTALNTITTPRGGQWQINLPDGSEVWLNAASSLKFPAKFAGNERRVILNGEAYFAVKHNINQPFRVQTAKQIVEDIGTEFNINSYSDENSTKTTLIEGSARVVPIFAVSPPRHPELDSGPRVNNDVVLKPGQQSVLRSETIKIKDVDTEETIAWKNGLFIFEGESLKNIMSKIARWYDVEIVYENEPNSNHVFQGKIARNRNISEVLKMIEYTGLVHFRIEGRRIIVRN